MSDTTTGREFIFVYGTLMRRYGATHLLGPDSVFKGLTDIPGVLLPLGGFPGFLPDNNCRVFGEVHEVDADTIPRLDRYENVPNLYIRRLVKTAFGDTWVYVYNRTIPLQTTTMVASYGSWNGKYTATRTYASECGHWRFIRGEDNSKALIPPVISPTDHLIERSRPPQDIPTSVCALPEPKQPELSLPEFE